MKFNFFKQQALKRHYFQGDQRSEVTRLSQMLGQSKNKHGDMGCCFEKFKLWEYIISVFPFAKYGEWHINVGSVNPYIEEGFSK